MIGGHCLFRKERRNFGSSWNDTGKGGEVNRLILAAHDAGSGFRHKREVGNLVLYTPYSKQDLIRRSVAVNASSKIMQCSARTVSHRYSNQSFFVAVSVPGSKCKSCSRTHALINLHSLL